MLSRPELSGVCVGVCGAAISIYLDDRKKNFLPPAKSVAYSRAENEMTLGFGAVGAC